MPDARLSRRDLFKALAPVALIPQLKGMRLKITDLKATIGGKVQLSRYKEKHGVLDYDKTHVWLTGRQAGCGLLELRGSLGGRGSFRIQNSKLRIRAFQFTLSPSPSRGSNSSSQACISASDSPKWCPISCSRVSWI